LKNGGGNKLAGLLATAAPPYKLAQLEVFQEERDVVSTTEDAGGLGSRKLTVKEDDIFAGRVVLRAAYPESGGGAIRFSDRTRTESPLHMVENLEVYKAIKIRHTETEIPQCRKHRGEKRSFGKDRLMRVWKNQANEHLRGAFKRGTPRQRECRNWKDVCKYRKAIEEM